MNQKRQPKGIETGGQFAPYVNPESTVVLDESGIEGPRYTVSLRDDDVAHGRVSVQSFQVGDLGEIEVPLTQSDFDSALNVAYNEDAETLLIELANGHIASVEPGDVSITEISPESTVSLSDESMNGDLSVPRDYSREFIDENKAAILDAEQNVESTIGSYAPDALFNSTTRELHDNMTIIVDKQKEIIFELESKLRVTPEEPSVYISPDGNFGDAGGMLLLTQSDLEKVGGDLSELYEEYGDDLIDAVRERLGSVSKPKVSLRHGSISAIEEDGYGIFLHETVAINAKIVKDDGQFVFLKLADGRTVRVDPIDVETDKS
jgi:hypothetical protein